MAPRPEGLKNEKQLYLEAIEEFAENSYQTASINEILKKAKVSKGSFYHHFKDKLELYLRTLTKVAAVQAEFAEKRFQEIRPVGRLDFFILLKVQGRLILDFADAHPIEADFLRQVRSEPEELQIEIAKHYSIEGLDYYIHMIEQAIARGELRRDLPIEVMGRLINHVMLNLSDFALPKSNFLGSRDDQAIDVQLDYLLSLLSSGMRR